MIYMRNANIQASYGVERESLSRDGTEREDKNNCMHHINMRPIGIRAKIVVGETK